MYKWKLEYILKNGVRLNGFYEGAEKNSDDVLKKLFAKSLDTFTPTYGENDQEILAVMIGEIAAVRVSIS